MQQIIHASFGVNRLNSLRARAASVKHKYYASFTINCHLNSVNGTIMSKEMLFQSGVSPSQSRKSITHLTDQEVHVILTQGNVNYRIGSNRTPPLFYT